MAPAHRADISIAQVIATGHVGGAGTNYLVQTPAGTLYCVYADRGADVQFTKSLDGGKTWSRPVSVFSGTVTGLAIWYDRWSNISAGLIHVAYQDSNVDDTFYRTIDTESSDALSTQTVIFAGASTQTGGHISITRAVGGNVYCKTVIDSGVEGGFYRLPNANVPNGAWDAARTIDETLATNDQIILAPDFDAADNQDIMAIFWDASANEISRKLYDDSGNSWAETSIATSMVDVAAALGTFPHFNIAVDIANTQIILVAWTGVDTANADLRCWTVDASTITEVTNVVLNSTDDQGLCAITLDTSTGYWWVFYCGNSAGSETWNTAVNIYCKVSTDGGTTWGSETQMSAEPLKLNWIAACPRWSSAFGVPPVLFEDNFTPDALKISIDLHMPRSTMQIGI